MRLSPSTLLVLTSLTCLATTVACTSGSAPELSGLTDQVAQVGTELQIDLEGTDPDGDRLAYGFRAADLPEVEAQVTVSPSGAGVFRWTPLAQDVGEHSFDFTVSDGDNTTTVTVTIDVKSAIGAATAPLFRQPLGSGTTIDMTKKKCVDLKIVIEDQNNADVTIAQEEPVIAGASLNQEDGLTATWQWCPTKEQEAENRYTLVLSADDGENPKTLKNYLVVLRGNTGTNCPGSAPAIVHTPQNAMTIVDLTIDAQVSDDKGLKEAPLFFFSETAPSNPPNLAEMQLRTTLLIDGTSTNATYAADVPNPVANLPAGTQKTLFYVFVADDDDDETGSCDHSTTSQVFQMTVTSSGPVNQPVCSTCSSDLQCGNADLCVTVGSQGATRCLQSCAGGCPAGYTCSTDPVTSVDGASALQCVPESGSCEMPTGGSCIDDANEEDDSRSAASANAAVDGPFQPGTIDAVSCPKVVQPPSGSKADDDWRQVVITTDTKFDMWLLGDDASDVDLTLYRSNETVLSRSTSLAASENIVQCLTPGTYYVKVNAFDAARSEYLLDYIATPQACNTTCVDDLREDDDTFSQARPTSQPFTSSGNKVCPNDDDWYKVRLFDGDKLVIDMTSTESGDLDLHLFKGEFNDLWPCSVTSSGTCTAAHGQSASANEHAEETIVSGCSAGCDYYVVVRGYDGAQSTNYTLTTRVE